MPEIQKNTTVSTDPDKRSHVLVNLDIVFPNAPCYLMDILMKTSVNEMDSEAMTKSLVWTHQDSENKEVASSKDNVVIFPDFNHTDTNSSD